jgi:short-subunit dehydrogenase
LLLDINEQGLQSLSEQLKAEHTSHPENLGIVPIKADLSSQQGIEEAVKALLGSTDRIDLLINNAGIGIYKKLPEVSWNDMQLSININLLAPYFLTQGLLPVLKTAGQSSAGRRPVTKVINIGSGTGVIAMPGRSPYVISKFAMRGMSLALAAELAETPSDDSPQVVLLTLGSMLTSFGPLSIEEKERLKQQGKGYLDPSWVAEKIVEISKLENPEPEYVFYPEGYDDPNTPPANPA